MSVNACPIANVNASIERVWSLLEDPRLYGQWWDALTCSIEPDGLARPGQVIRAETRALGRGWNVSFRVNRVDPTRHQIDLTAFLPLGITIHNVITANGLSPTTCRLSFG